MGLLIFLSVVGAVAACVGVWGVIQLRNEDRHTDDGCYELRAKR